MIACLSHLFGGYWIRNSRPVAGAAISKLEQKGKFVSESESTVTEAQPAVKLIPLINGKFSIVDAADFDALMLHRWSAAAYGNTYYAKRLIWRNGKPQTILMHQAVLGVKGIDHRDRNGLNNTRSNLRPATGSQNQANRGINTGKVGYKGVFPHKFGGWFARIVVRKKPIYLGYSSDATMLALKYDAAAIKHFGEFACTNKQLGLLP